MARDLFECLDQWFQLFPEYLENDFYVFGESYAGMEKVKVSCVHPCHSISL